MNRSLPRFALFSYLFLLTNLFSIHAQSLLTKNITVNKKNVFSNTLLEQTAASTQPDVSAFTNKLNTEGLRFTENKGQVADLQGKLRSDVLFTAHSSGAKLFLTANGICYQFSRQFLKKEIQEDKLPSKFTHADVDSTQFYRVDVKLVDANLHPDIIKEGEGSGVENFYLAHCPNGILNVKNYSKITYKNVYPNIDWVVYSKEGTLEYDFVVRPGGKVSDIKLQYDGAEKISLDDKGAVTIETRLGSVSEHKPASFEQDGKEIVSQFVLKENTLNFAINEYDKSKILIIDPSIAWTNNYGDVGDDRSNACITDAEANVYMAGYTSSNSNIAFNGFQNIYGGGNYDALLVKFNSLGKRLWATYYGGNNSDYFHFCSINQNGSLYLVGSTQSTMGISSNGFQNTYGGGNLKGGDAFLVKFNSLGERLWATYYGGSKDDYGNSCTLDKIGNIYLAGYTRSDTGIASNGFKNLYTSSNEDAFLIKFDSLGNRLWGTYYGGYGDDYGYACTVDKTNNVYLSGYTSSNTDISLNGVQNSYGGGIYDAFLVKFNLNGERLWSTYYGGEVGDEAWACSTDDSNHIYLVGQTSSSRNISFNGFQNIFGTNEDAFLAKFDSSGERIWATYYGGSGGDIARSCVIDNVGNIYLAGNTTSTYNIAFNGFQNEGGGTYWDAFMVKFNSLGGRSWGTYFGESFNDDYGYACSLDRLGSVYLSGYNFKIQGAYGAFITKIVDEILPLHLLSFTASLQNKAVNLAWQTVQEINTSYFVVERSKDGSNYNSLQQVTAGSNSGIYTTMDNSPLWGKSLYRLKMVDKDGKITYSNAVPISYIIKEIVTVSPNPTRDKLTVQLQSISDAKASIRICDVNGKIIYTKQLPVKSGINTLSVPVASFAKGAYLLTVVQGSDKQTVKWIKE